MSIAERRADRVSYTTKSGAQQYKMPVEVFEDPESDTMGFCLACGEFAYGVEPDARKYECDSCGEHKVYGCGEIALMGLTA
jgi:hypothetical protein